MTVNHLTSAWLALMHMHARLIIIIFNNNNTVCFETLCFQTHQVLIAYVRHLGVQRVVNFSRGNQFCIIFATDVICVKIFYCHQMRLNLQETF